MIDLKPLTLILLFFTCLIVLNPVTAQIVGTKKIRNTFSALPTDSLPGANALVFQPKGFEKIVHPKPEPTLQSRSSLDSVVIVGYGTTLAERVKLDPYAAFYEPVIFRKGVFFMGYSTSEMRLDVYFRYSRDTLSIEEQRRKHNLQFIHSPEDLGLQNNYTLLENVNNKALKWINADTAFIYNTNIKYKFKSDTANYGSFVVNLIKFDLARVRLVFYYPLGREKEALREISATWGVVRFNSDTAFRRPHGYKGGAKTALYFGKFSFLNNMEQLKNDSLLFEVKKSRVRSQLRLREGIQSVLTGDYGKARDIFLSIPVTDTVITTAVYTQLIHTALFLKQSDSAWLYWRRLNAVAPPGDLEVMQLKGVVQQTTGDLIAAEQTFYKLLQDGDTLNIPLHLLLVKTYNQQHKTKEALKALERLLHIFKEEKESAGMVRRLLMINDLAFTKLEYARILFAENNNRKCIAILQSIFKDEEEQAAAIARNEKTVLYGPVEKPLKADSYLLLGVTYGAEKDFENARLYLHEAQDWGKILPEQLQSFLMASDYK